MPGGVADARRHLIGRGRNNFGIALSGPLAFAEPNAIAVTEPIAVGEPIAIAVTEPIAIGEPFAVAEPNAVTESIAIGESAATGEPIAIAESNAVAQPITNAESFAVAISEPDIIGNHGSVSNGRHSFDARPVPVAVSRALRVARSVVRRQRVRRLTLGRSVAVAGHARAGFIAITHGLGVGRSHNHARHVGCRMPVGAPGYARSASGWYTGSGPNHLRRAGEPDPPRR